MDVKRAFSKYVGSTPGLGSYFFVLQDSLRMTKLRVDLVISITLQDSSFSRCSHNPVWIQRDKRNFYFLLLFSIYLLLHIYL